MRISILGAGHGGLAAAADLTLMGHEVKLSAVNKHDKNIQLLKAFKKIMLAGLHRMTGRLGMLFGVAIFEVILSFNLQYFNEIKAYQCTYIVAMIICVFAAIFSAIKRGND